MTALPPPFADLFADPAAPFASLAGPAAQIVLHGDCLAHLARIRDSAVDVVVTSPPYNINLQYNTFRDDMDRQTYLAWLRAVAAELRRVLKDDGSFFLNIGATSADPWIPMQVAMALQDVFVLQNSIVWVKSVSVGERTFGHFKPVNSKRYLNHCWEPVLHWTKRGGTALDRLAIGVPFTDKSNVARFGAAGRADRRCGGNVWFIPYETVRSKAGKHHHPATFPVELARRCIALHGQPGGVVLDPFAGAGSTLLAARRLGCTGIGIELDALYCETARERLIAEDTARAAG